jgi:Uma2 family endonuclease
MATRTLITEEEFLRMSFDGPEPDYVDGEVVERAVPNNSHSSAQLELSFVFRALQERLALFPRPELRLRVAPGKYRTADLAVYAHREPTEAVPPEIPLVVIEIVSPDDKYENLMKKLSDYQSWGVPHIWLVDPGLRGLSVYRDGALIPVAAYELPEFGVRITPEQVFR